MGKANVLLLILVVLSAIGVVAVQDRSRQNFMALNRATADEQMLNEDYSRLELVQAKLSGHEVVREAAARQNMHLPTLAETRMITVPFPDTGR